ncbi:hypothetical protein [Streptomyces sp. NPDC002104]
MADHQPDSTPQPDHGPVLDWAAALTDHLKAGPGGAMADEVAVITGDVTLTSEAGPDGATQVRIQYTGAEERYTLTGSPHRSRPAARPPSINVVEAVKAGGAAEVPATTS